MVKICSKITSFFKKRDTPVFDKIKSIIEIGAIISGVYFGISELSSMSIQIEEQTIWNKKDVTFQYIEKYTENLIITANNLYMLDKDKINEILNDSSKRANIVSLAAYFEHLAIGIEKNYFDEEVAKSILIRQAINVYNKLKELGYFELRKKEEELVMYGYFQRLAMKWRKTWNQWEVERFDNN